MLERRKTELVAQLQRTERCSCTREQFELAALRKDVAVAEEKLEKGCDLLSRERKATAQGDMQILAAMKERTEHVRRRLAPYLFMMLLSRKLLLKSHIAF